MKNRLLKLTVSETLFIILIFSTIFYSFGIKYCSKYFNYMDDFLFIMLFGLALLKIIMKKNKKKLNNYDKIIIFFMLLLVIEGILGNIISNYQNSIQAIIIDIFTTFKFFGVYISCKILFKEKKAERNYKIAEYVSKIVLILMLCITILNTICDWKLAEKYTRFGINSYSLGGHPTFAAAIACCCVSILLSNYKKNKKWVFLGLILTAMTLRIKAIAYVLIMIIILLSKKGEKSFQARNLVIYGFIAIIIAHKYIINYFFDITASRGAAMIASLKLAVKYFPIGSGFATFGTVQSIKSYSKAYEVLGLNNRYGFMKNAGAFSGDGGWATYIGQYGFIGCFILISMIFLIYKSIKFYNKKDSNYYPYISILLYLLICSTSEIAFSSNYAVLFAISLVILINKNKIKKDT